MSKQAQSTRHFLLTHSKRNRVGRTTPNPKWIITKRVVEFIQPKRPDRRSFPPHGDIPIRQAVLVDNNKYHPRTANRFKETRKAAQRALLWMGHSKEFVRELGGTQ